MGNALFKQRELTCYKGTPEWEATLSFFCFFYFLISNLLILTAPKIKIVKFANRVDPDEAAHNELPHLDLHCLPSIL